MLPQEYINLDIDIPLESSVIEEIEKIKIISNDKIYNLTAEDKSSILEVYQKGGYSEQEDDKKSLRENFVNSGFIKINSEKITVIPPTYKYNKFGFRSDEFSIKQEGIICLGCSDTFGQYQFEQNTWPRILAKEMGLKCYNLGAPGASINYTYFLLKKFITKINSRNVFLLTPSIYRTSYFDDRNVCINISPSNLPPDLTRQNYYNHYINQPLELLFEYNCNLDAIRFLCKKYDKKLYILPNPSHYDLAQQQYFDNIPLPLTDRAADGYHMGKVSQEILAQKFLSMYYDD